MKLIKILLLLSLVATIVIYLFPRTWELDLIASLQENRSSFSVHFWQFISDSKSFISVGIPVIALTLGFFRRDKALVEKAFLILVTLAVAGILSVGVKKIVREPRPYEVDQRIAQLSGGGGYGFPSGHTLEAVAAATAISFLWPETGVVLVSVVWVLLTMASRVYLGVHDPGDVMGGTFLGILSFVVVITARDYFARRRKTPPAK